MACALLALALVLSAGPATAQTEGAYVVRPGDTLYAISQRFDTTVDALLAANPSIENRDLIFVGQTLMIPERGHAGPPSFDLVEIPLIALNGGDLGCGDRVVFVPRQVTPTRAPLTAALRELLALDERMLGQSGLYNALAASDLDVANVVIVGRTAYVALTGDLSLGGACDSPRVAAQLRQVALQYDTVDDVRVRINDQPLEQVLSAR